MSGYFLNPFFTCDHPLVKDVRGIGMMGGVELHADGHPGKRGTNSKKSCSGRVFMSNYWRLEL